MPGPRPTPSRWPWAAVLLVFLTSALPARVITWKRDVGGVWSDTANWNPPIIPTSGDTAVISRGNITVILDLNRSLARLELSGTATLQITGYHLYLTDGVVGPQARILLSGVLSASAWGTGLLIQGQLMFSGGSLSYATLQGQTQITGPDTAKMIAVENQGNLIWSGGIWYPLGIFRNHGTVILRGDSLSIPYNAGSGEFLNDGTLVKEGGDTTWITSTGRFNNEEGGTVQVRSGELFVDASSQLHEGGFQVDSGAVLSFDAYGTRFQDVVFSGSGLVRFLNTMVFGDSTSEIEAPLTVILENGGIEIDHTVLSVSGRLIAAGNFIRGRGQSDLTIFGSFQAGVDDASLDIDNIRVNVFPPGEMTWGEGMLSLGNGGTIVIWNGGSLIISVSGSNISREWEGSGVILNLGVVEKRRFTTVAISPRLINSTRWGTNGLLRVKEGTLTLWNTVGEGGTFVVDSGALLRLRGRAGDTFGFGNFEGSGTVRTIWEPGWPMIFDSAQSTIRRPLTFQDSARTYIRAPVLVENGVRYEKHAYELYIRDTLRVAGTFHWTQGEILPDGDPHRFLIAQGGVLEIADTLARLGVVADIEGLLRFTDGARLTVIRQGAGVEVLTWGTWRFEGEGSVRGTGLITNHGLVEKTGNGVAWMGAFFRNDGTFRVTEGELRFSGGSWLEGVGEFPGGALYFDAILYGDTLKGVTFRGDSGTLYVWGPWVAQGNLGPSAVLERGTLDFSGTLKGSGNPLVVGDSATFRFRSGSFTDSATVRVDSGGVFLFADTTSTLMGGSRLLNRGTIRWEGGSIHLASLYSSDSGRIENDSTGLFQILREDTTGELSLSGGILVNRGRLRKEGAGRVGFSPHRLKNTGIIEVQGGTLELDPLSGGGGLIEGVLATPGGDITLGYPDTLRGTRITATPPNRVAAPSPGQVRIEGSVVVWIQDSVLVDTSGKLCLCGGALRGTNGYILVLGELLWEAGDLEADVSVESGGVLRAYTDTGIKRLFSRITVRNGGQMSWQGGPIAVNADSTNLMPIFVDNGGHLALSDTGTAFYRGIGGDPDAMIYTLGGLLSATGLDPEGEVRLRLPVNLRGNLRVDSVHLVFQRGGLYAGEISGSGVVVLRSPSTAPDTLQGLTVTSGASLYLEGITVISHPIPTLPGLTNAGGDVEIRENARVQGPGWAINDSSGTVYWRGGGRLEGWLELDNRGQVIVAGGGTGAREMDRAFLTNRGTVFLYTPLFLRDSAGIFNDSGGTLIALDSASLWRQGVTPANPWVENLGEFRVSTGSLGSPDTVTVGYGVRFRQRGRLILQEGVLRVEGTPGDEYAGEIDLWDEGTLLLRRTGHRFLDNLRLRSHPGSFRAEVVIRGRVVIEGGVRVDSGAVLALEQGELAFAFDSLVIGISGTLRMKGGVISDSGAIESQYPLQILPGGTCLIQTPSGDIDTLEVNLQNRGVLRWDSSATGELRLNDGADIENEGQMLLHAPVAILSSQSSWPTIVENTGTIELQTSGGFLIEPLLWNRGTLHLLQGDLTAEKIVQRDTAEITLEEGTTLFVSSDSLLLSGGRLQGRGTVSGRIRVQGGHVAPGTSPGRLTVGPFYTQETGGVLEIEVGGTTPGLTHDQLALGPHTTLAGSLVVYLVDGYTPTGGERFAILQYPHSAPPQGDFTEKVLPDLPGGGTFRTLITDSAYILRTALRPVANPDAFTVQEDQGEVLLNLIDNDADPDSDEIYVSALITAGTRGTVTLDPILHLVSYTPPPESTGVDSFRYVLQDTTGMEDTGRVQITITPVNDPPEVSFFPIGNTLAFDEDASATLDLDDFVTDPDNAPEELTWSWSIGPPLRGRKGLFLSRIDPPNPKKPTNPTNSTDAINPDDSLYISIDPVTHIATFWGAPNYNNPGGIPVTFTATDPDGASDSDVLTVIINAVPDPPDAVDDQATTDEDTPVTIPVLVNDGDPDGDPITLVGATDPAHGSITINPDQTITYAPDSNFSGQDQFVYTITDGQYQDAATVTIIVQPVNDPPQAQADAYATEEDTPLSVGPPGVLGNDSDPEGDPLTAILETEPAHGVLTLNTDGSFVYEPNLNYNGDDSFTYRASDGHDLSDPSTVAITVSPVNDTPVVAGMPDITFPEDSSYTLPLDPYVTDPDNSPDEMTWSVQILGLSPHPSLRQLTDSPIHPLTDSLVVVIDSSTRVAHFQGMPNFYGDSIPVVFVATDPEGAWDSDTLLVTITPVNDPPQAPVRVLPEDGDTLVSDSGVAFVWRSSGDVEGDSVWYRLRVVIEGVVDTVLDTLVEVGDTNVVMGFGGLMLPSGVWGVDWVVGATDGMLESWSDWGRFWLEVPVGVRETEEAQPGVFGAWAWGNGRELVVRYTLPEPGRVEIRVYDVRGRLVTRWRRLGAAGSGRWRWQDIRSGVYFVRVEAVGEASGRRWHATRSVIYLKR